MTLIKNYGVSNLYGNVIGNDGTELPKIGYVDTKTAEMEPIKLMQGKFPDAPDEVAVELSYLTELGYDVKLNQEITLQVQVREKDTSTGENEVVAKSLKVCGIVEDYSRKLKGTNLDKIDYVSFFISEDNPLTEYKMQENLVMQLKDSYMENYTELVDAVGVNGSLIGNNYTYFQMSGESGYQMSMDELKCDLVIVAVILIFSMVSGGFVWSYMKSQKELWRVCVSLGATMGRIRWMVMHQVLKRVLVSGGIGIFVIFGTFFYKVCVSYSVNWKLDAVKFILLSLMNGFIILVISGLGMFDTQRWKARLKLLQCKYNWKKHKDKLSIDYKILGKKTIKACTGFQVKLCVITSVFLGVISIAFCLLYERKNDFEVTKSLRNAEYEFGSLFMLSNTQSSISGEQYNQLSEVYGTEYIELFQGVDKVRLEKSTNEKNNHNLYNDNQGYVIGIETEGQAYDYYADEIDMGKINNGAFENGEEIIIVISDDILSDNMTSIYSDDAPKSILKQIRVGDEAVLSKENINLGVTVGGIIREFNQISEFQISDKSLTIIGSFNLMKKIKQKVETFEYFYMYMENAELNQIQEQLEMSTVVSGMRVVNNRAIVEEYQSKYLKCLFFVVVLCIMLITLYIFIRNYYWYNNQKRIGKFLSIIEMLAGDTRGMKKKIYLKTGFYFFLFLGLSLVGVVIFMLGVFCCKNEIPASVNYLEYCWKTRELWMKGIPWTAIGTVGVIVIIDKLLENKKIFKM